MRRPRLSAGDRWRTADPAVAKVSEASSATYFVCDFAFGSIGVEAARHSAELFAAEIMPAFVARA